MSKEQFEFWEAAKSPQGSEVVEIIEHLNRAIDGFWNDGADYMKQNDKEICKWQKKSAAFIAALPSGKGEQCRCHLTLQGCDPLCPVHGKGEQPQGEGETPICKICNLLPVFNKWEVCIKCAYPSTWLDGEKEAAATIIQSHLKEIAGKGFSECIANVKTYMPWNRDLLRYLETAKNDYLAKLDKIKTHI